MKTIVNYAQKVKEQHALNKTLAPVETDLTDASRSYAIGEQFINDGDLFRAKTPIAQHDALVLDTNYEYADDITTQIKNKTVTTDPVPTEGSSNPVQSNGVYVENQTLTQNKLTTGVLDLTAMAEYSNDLLLVPNGLWFVRAAVLSSSSILNKPPVNVGGILISRDNPAPGNQFEFLPFESIYPRYHWSGLHNTASEVGGWKPMMQSNPNLLDNPFFTVNQRGASQYTASTDVRVFTVDRWATASGATGGNTTVEVVTNGVNLTTADDASDNATLTQHFDNASLFGKTVTISAIIEGVSYIATGTVPSAKTSSWQQVCRKEIDGVSIAFLVTPSTYTAFQFEFIIRTPKDNNAYNVRAVKLEIGDISTLAMDTAPNYQQELAKCQRYFNRIGHASEYVGVGVGQAWTDNVACIHVPLSVPMRAKPSVTQSGSGYANLRNQQTVIGTVSSYTVDGVGQNEIMLRFGTSNTPLTAGLVYEAFLAGGRYIDLSADI